MPILGESTEFAAKWSSLCDAHLKEGIRDPIVAYEYMNHYYIQEGNKRVSVLKYFDAISIPGYVTRIIPAREDTNFLIFTMPQISTTCFSARKAPMHILPFTLATADMNAGAWMTEFCSAPATTALLTLSRNLAVTS